MQDQINALKAKVADLESRIESMSNWRDPNRVEERFQSIFTTVDSMANDVALISAAIKNIQKDPEHLEEFNDEDFKNYYDQSGLTTQDVKAFIIKNFEKDGTDVSLSKVSRYVNGQVKDKQNRSIFGRWLREQATTRNAKGVYPASRD